MTEAGVSRRCTSAHKFTMSATTQPGGYEILSVKVTLYYYPFFFLPSFFLSFSSWTEKKWKKYTATYIYILPTYTYCSYIDVRHAIQPVCVSWALPAKESSSSSSEMGRYVIEAFPFVGSRIRHKGTGQEEEEETTRQQSFPSLLHRNELFTGSMTMTWTPQKSNSNSVCALQFVLFVGISSTGRRFLLLDS